MSLQSEAFCTFLVEWFDTQATLVRRFNLRYFPADGQLDMFDLKTNRTFLKKCHYPSITLQDLYPGAQISVYSRPLKVIDFADEATRKFVGTQKESAVVIIKGNSGNDVAELLISFAECGLTLAHASYCTLTQQHVSSLSLPSQLAGAVSAFQVIGSNPVGLLSNLSQRAGGKGALSRVIINGGQAAQDQCKVLFTQPQQPQQPTHTASLSRTAASVVHKPVLVSSGRDCAVLLIKPHAVVTGAAGPIVSSLVQSGLTISGMELLQFDRPAANEFLEVYKGVVPEYNGMVEQLVAGPVLALEVQMPSSPSKVVSHLRELCGPMDPEIARHLRPTTIRARFGQNKVMNAVHCTDLPEDGSLESQYIFQILQH